MSKRLKARLETLSRAPLLSTPLPFSPHLPHNEGTGDQEGWQRTVVGMAKVTLAQALDQLTVKGELYETLDRGLQPHA